MSLWQSLDDEGGVPDSFALDVSATITLEISLEDAALLYNTLNWAADEFHDHNFDERLRVMCMLEELSHEVRCEVARQYAEAEDEDSADR